MFDNNEHPVIVELRSRIKECRQELLNLLYDWHYLQNILHPQIVFQYDSYFGDLEFDLQKKSRVAAEIERRVELLSVKLRRGERLTEKTIKFVNLLVQKEFERKYASENRTSNNGAGYDKRNDYSSANNGDCKIRRPEDEEPNLFQNDYDLTDYEYKPYSAYEAPKLYRKLVKKLHPDISGETEAFNRFWCNVQDAYRSNDVNRLRLFHQTLCADDENRRYSDNKTEEMNLRTEISQLEKNIIIEKRK